MILKFIKEQMKGIFEIQIKWNAEQQHQTHENPFQIQKRSRRYMNLPLPFYIE